MLKLSRAKGERILIGEDVVIEVVEIGRGKVRLGLTAPRDVPIFREELLKPPPSPPGDGKPPWEE
jgi:carbon storage regulator